MEIEQILYELQTALTDCRTATTEYRDKNKALDQRSKDFLKQEDELAQKVFVFKQREAAVVKLENVAKAQQEANDLVRDAKNFQEQLRNDRLDFERHRKIELDRMQSLTETSGREAKNNDNMRKWLEDRAAALDAEVNLKLANILLKMGIKQADVIDVLKQSFQEKDPK